MEEKDIINKIEIEILQLFNKNIQEYKKLLIKYDYMFKEKKISDIKRQKFNNRFIHLLKKIRPLVNDVFEYILNEELERYYRHLSTSNLFCIPYFDKNYDVKQVIKIIKYKNKKNNWNENTDITTEYYEYKIFTSLQKMIRNVIYNISVFLLLFIAFFIYIYYFSK